MDDVKLFKEWLNALVAGPEGHSLILVSRDGHIDIQRRTFDAHERLATEAKQAAKIAALRERVAMLERASQEVADAGNDMVAALNDTVTPLTPEKYNSAGRRIQDAIARIDTLLKDKHHD